MPVNTVFSLIHKGVFLNTPYDAVCNFTPIFQQEIASAEREQKSKQQNRYVDKNSFRYYVVSYKHKNLFNKFYRVNDFGVKVFLFVLKFVFKYIS